LFNKNHPNSGVFVAFVFLLWQIITPQGTLKIHITFRLFILWSPIKETLLRDSKVLQLSRKVKNSTLMILGGGIH